MLCPQGSRSYSSQNGQQSERPLAVMGSCICFILSFSSPFVSSWFEDGMPHFSLGSFFFAAKENDEGGYRQEHPSFGTVFWKECLHLDRGRLPLFTENPTRVIPGNRASGMGASRKPVFIHPSTPLYSSGPSRWDLANIGHKAYEYRPSGVCTSSPAPARVACCWEGAS